MTRTAQTDEQRDRTEKCVKMDAVLSKLHTMTAGQLAAHAENEHGTVLTLENGRTWLHRKVAYMEQARIYGGLTGPAADRAAALDTPSVIAELKVEDAEIEELINLKTKKHGGSKMSDETKTTMGTKTKKATTPKATTPKATTPKATTPKATTPKATTPKATTERKGRAGKYAATDKITMLTKENPKRPGSSSYERFKAYFKSKTVEDFLQAGGSRSDLDFDAKHGFIKVGG